jgi:hypothetical protein
LNGKGNLFTSDFPAELWSRNQNPGLPQAASDGLIERFQGESIALRRPKRNKLWRGAAATPLHTLIVNLEC